MRKILFSLSVCMCIGFTANAQDVDDPAYVNKRGISLLPQAGDYAIGVDATPFLGYLGNIFSNYGNDSPYFNGVNQSIYGKYFLNDDRAIRAKLTMNLMNNVEKGVVPDDEQVANNPLNPDASVVDVWKATNGNIGLGVGYEFRRGKGRVQGFWGGELLIGLEFHKDKFEYANPITEINQNPSSFLFSGNISNTNSRSLERKTGMIFSGGIGGFVGVEYFFAPQISLGGELGLQLILRLESQSETKWESWNVLTNELQTQTDRKSKNWWSAQKAGLMTNATYGSIFIMFHF